MTSLSYAHGVALEVLRLHPSVPKDIKVAVRDDTLPDGTRIPAGCSVLWCPYAMNRDARFVCWKVLGSVAAACLWALTEPLLLRYWPNPLAFDPTRFLETDGDAGASATSKVSQQESAFS